MTYLWLKTLHLVFVIAWMACVFYLPRILVNMAETVGESAVQARLALMGRRLYRFGHIMFGFMLTFGLILMIGYKLIGGWMHVKLLLVALLFAYYILSGIWLKRAAAGGALPSSRILRWFNELPVFLLLAIVFLVLAKPF